MSVLALDQGTTSTRAVVMGEDGQPRVLVAREHHQFYPRSGWVEHDPEELIASLRNCIEAAGTCSAIGIDNQGESCLAWDGDSKQAISPVIVWQDNRTQDRIERLQAEGAESVTLERAGLPLDSYFSATKLAWILENIPEAAHLHQKGRLRLGTTDAFFLDRLTGHFVTDISTASRTSLMNLATGAWDEELCRLFGVPMECLPRIVSSTGDFGAIETERGAVPVTASIVDQQAALYGHGCRTAGHAKVTFGTGAFALMVTGAEIFRSPEEGLLPTVAWQKEGEAPVYALDGGIYCASAAVNWARELGLFRTVDELNAFEGPPVLERGLVFVPALAGLACPHWDRGARGLWAGLSLETSGLDMARAVLEGVACRAAEVLGAMQARLPITDALSIDGGMAKNPCFRQFLADLLERDIVQAASSELTALGTLQLAGEASGQLVSYQSAGRVIAPETPCSHLLPRFQQAVAFTQAWPDRAES
ncbi:FGGY family carbohydrate kinase [Fodinicurvata sediminis]|uniref:FGGY family carbohydrate kinase n=1 Tax=Fodinicurvata sediminis TaxID=1121832 RepID=UPI0003B30A97|nr:FGGY family carbohydrate kinase [Fodinicurvata sediminis]